ncbi:FecR family protein [Larkinella rosea]|uniref:FecR family protein n=1 Tax=Larkinella rosea TaxID=2025312 RepID=A0A3P1BCN0_9BACT|nr:FecR family protein [Larkinella rosea]RRA98867.1 FecR family protein [Larkinella rosea]
MNHYAEFTAEEFAEDDFFRRWVQSPDAGTEIFWQEFLVQHPEKHTVMVTARSLLRAIEQVQVMPTEAQGERMWAAIEQRTTGLPGQVDASELETENRWMWPKLERPNWWQLAAAVILLAGIGWWFSLKSKLSDQPETYSGLVSQSRIDLVEKINNTSKPLTVRFEEGSSVVLQPDSRVSYPATFAAEKRDVFLSGEGFFEVSKNPERPFMVYANGLVTKVIGTSFMVRALEKANRVTVIVRTGKVAVFPIKSLDQKTSASGQPAGALLLTPNQQAFFEPTSDRLTRQLVETPALIKVPEHNQNFIFEDTPVAEVFKTLETSYGVTIAYDAKTLQSCNLTAPLGDEPLFRKLDIICQTIGATYEVLDAKIVVTGKGCQPTE